MTVKDIPGVPAYECAEYAPKASRYCVLIPIINEGERIRRELRRAQAAGVSKLADLVICDGGSTDGCTEEKTLRALGVNTLLTKTGPGKQGAQLRMGFWFALQRGYEGIVTIDGNDKDSIESVPLFLEKIEQGFDFVQGSRFIRGGVAEHTPPVRWLAVRLVLAPVISLTAGVHFTDTTNAFRAYSRRYLEDARVQPFRDVFSGYELLAYLSTRAGQLKLRCCEVPVARRYPANAPAPTKIKGMRGNFDLLRILFANARGCYTPKG